MADKDKDGDEVELTIADETVVTKYKTAGEIANRKWTHRSYFFKFVSPHVPSMANQKTLYKVK